MADFKTKTWKKQKIILNCSQKKFIVKKQTNRNSQQQQGKTQRKMRAQQNEREAGMKQCPLAKSKKV